MRSNAKRWLLRKDFIRQKYAVNLSKLRQNRSYDKATKAWKLKSQSKESTQKYTERRSNERLEKRLKEFPIENINIDLNKNKEIVFKNLKTGKKIGKQKSTSTFIKTALAPFRKTLTVTAKVKGKRMKIKIGIYTAAQQQKVTNMLRQGKVPVPKKGNRVDMLLDKEKEDYTWEKTTIHKVDS